MTTLTPILTGTPGQFPSYNVGMAETFSWVPIENNVNRPLFARASYITNLKDLSISLSASDIHIGGVELTDGEDHSITATIIHTSSQGNALQVTSINPPVTAVNILNHTIDVSGSVTVINSVSSISLTNQLTGISVLNDVQVHASSTFPVSGSVTITNPVTAMNVTVVNPASAVSIVTFADGLGLDQSGRLRVSQPGVQWWYSPTVDKDGDFRYVESFTPGASSYYIQNLAQVEMTPGTSSSGYAIRASRKRHKIQPGLSHAYYGTWNWDGAQENVVKRVGMFNGYNGLFFELSGSAMSLVVRRRLIDGTLVEERATKGTWNGDNLSGNGQTNENWDQLLSASITNWVSTSAVSISPGISAYNVTYSVAAGTASTFGLGTKATVTGVTPATYNGVALVKSFNDATNQIALTYTHDPGAFISISTAKMDQTSYHGQHSYWIDFMGGRTNRVRFGIFTDYGQELLHKFEFDGKLGTSYENAPALMDRKEIQNVGTVSYRPSMTIAGNSFSVEASTDVNPAFGVVYNNTGVAYTTVGQEYPILGLALRIGEPYQRASVQVNSISMIDLANAVNTGAEAPATFFWRLLLNPGLSGVPNATDTGKATRFWKYTTTTAVTGNGFRELLAGYTQSAQTLAIGTALNFLDLGANIEYTDTDKLVLMVKMIAAGKVDSSIVASINYIESL